MLLRLPGLDELLELLDLRDLAKVEELPQYESMLLRQVVLRDQGYCVLVVFLHRLQYLRWTRQKLLIEVHEPVKTELLQLAKPIQARRHILDQVAVQHERLQADQVSDLALQLDKLIVIENEVLQVLLEQHHAVRQRLQIVVRYREVVEILQAVQPVGQGVQEVVVEL